MVNKELSHPRSIGVLLHPTALPNSPVCGSFGSPSRDWLRLLANHGIGVWQFLPLCPPDSTGSPYSSPSAFALNPWFLDANDLKEEGFLSPNSLEQLPGQTEMRNPSVDFSLANDRIKKLGNLLRIDWPKQSLERNKEFNQWVSNNGWLEDYVTFVELQRQFEGLPWWKWPDEFRNYEINILNKWRVVHENNLLEHRLIQWHLNRQWILIRKLAKELGVLLFGDMPFYVSRDSADVWGNRKLFSISDTGSMDVQSGVPPDYFSSTGQLWGTPVYLWDNHKENEFYWWRQRVSRQWEHVDLLRLDHFRALIAYWAIPGEHETAENGTWQNSPGKHLLELFEKDFKGRLNLVAEDLGIITNEVEKLRDEFKLPGMKILQFAFNGDLDNPYLPENFKGSLWVVYSGTHDNPTTLSWWYSLDESIRDKIKNQYVDENLEPAWKIIDIGMSTDASLFIAPLQDILNLDDNARFNKPGTIGENWKWRLDNIDGKLAGSLKRYGKRSIYWGRSFKDAIYLLK
tara:strand:- start:216 stop:1760 length:1545 start_codon:yes stop_codon:yes gene_type:complete